MGFFVFGVRPQFSFPPVIFVGEVLSCQIDKTSEKKVVHLHRTLLIARAYGRG